jgi:hypothetical protein
MADTPDTIWSTGAATCVLLLPAMLIFPSCGNAPMNESKDQREHLAIEALEPIFHRIDQDSPLLIGDDPNEVYSKPEQAVVFISLLDSIISMNGFREYFKRSISMHTPETHEALLNVGALQCAAIFDEARHVFFGSEYGEEAGLEPEQIYEMRCRRSDALTTSEADRLRTIDQQFMDMMIEEELFVKTLRFYCAHAGEPLPDALIDADD